MEERAEDARDRSPPPLPQRWTVYVLRSTQLRRTYVGITTDVERRLSQHNGEITGGARSTRAGRPWEVATTYGPYETRGEALRVELRVKKLRGEARLRYADQQPSTHS